MSTIAAIATPQGQGGIAIIRMSGSKAKKILETVFKPASRTFCGFKPWRLHRGIVHDSKNEAIDDCLAVFMPAPNTFTGEDTAEIHCHGGIAVTRDVLESLFAHGAYPAERGEFTRRAFLNGRMDLSQAEAVAELISANGYHARRLSFKRLNGALSKKASEIQEIIDDIRQKLTLSLDFSEEDIPDAEPGVIKTLVQDAITGIECLLKTSKRASVFETGAQVLIAGSVNAGKSSLFNLIAGKNRALVTPQPGTTRDYLEIDVNLDGLAVKLIDTAGIRSSTDAGADELELMGIAKSRELVHWADAILLVLDSAYFKDNAKLLKEPDELHKELLDIVKEKKVIVVWNKCDLCSPQKYRWLEKFSSCEISALTGMNLDMLLGLLKNTLLGDIPLADGDVAPNQRQAECLLKAKEELEHLQCALSCGLSCDCALASLETAEQSLSQIIGHTCQEEILNRIFASFCIGK